MDTLVGISGSVKNKTIKITSDNPYAIVTSDGKYSITRHAEIVYNKYRDESILNVYSDYYDIHVNGRKVDGSCVLHGGDRISLNGPAINGDGDVYELRKFMSSSHTVSKKMNKVEDVHLDYDGLKTIYNFELMSTYEWDYVLDVFHYLESDMDIQYIGIPSGDGTEDLVGKYRVAITSVQAELIAEHDFLTIAGKSRVCGCSIMITLYNKNNIIQVSSPMKKISAKKIKKYVDLIVSETTSDDSIATRKKYDNKHLDILFWMFDVAMMLVLIMVCILTFCGKMDESGMNALTVAGWAGSFIASNIILVPIMISLKNQGKLTIGKQMVFIVILLAIFFMGLLRK